MSEYNSSDSVLSEEPAQDLVINFLESFKFRKVEFSAENLAKEHGVCTDLTESQETFLSTLKDFLKCSYNTYESFMSVVQDLKDFRSFRVLYGQGYGTFYDYSLICFDIYLHDFLKPTVFLRTGHPDCSLSLLVTKKGLLKPELVPKSEPDEDHKIRLENFFFNLHSEVLINEDQLKSTKKYSNAEVPQSEIVALQNYLKYASIKYGVYENLANPLPEFSEVIKAYFILFNYNLAMHLDSHSPLEGIEILIPIDSLVAKKNPKLLAFFSDVSFNKTQLDLYTQVRSILQSLPSPKQAYGLDYGNTAPVYLQEGSQNDPQPPESISSYYQLLKSHRFNQFDFWSAKNLVLKASVQEEGPVNTSRLSKEIRVLSQHLPCETTGAIFVVMDSERMDLMKALISGTEDTPYAHGLYEFHIACPAEYPNKPPLVNIVTTGKGNVRFNPNLYDDGYVCLSVINTWDGDPSERWNPTHSNILQVLLSIQVLVMDNMIIQKEPDFEYLKVDSWENIMYSNIVRFNNMKYAMLEMIKNPPDEFKEVISLHFAMKRNAIIETVDKWIDDAKNFELPKNIEIDFLVKDHNPITCNLFKTCSYYSLLVEARNELLKILDTLPDVGVARKDFQLIEITDFDKFGEYYTKMNSFIIQEKNFKEAGGYRHSLAKHVSLFKDYSSRAERFKQDLESLKKIKQSALNNVFMCYDSERLDLIKILVVGPLDTNYADGLFLFELACPESYPKAAPIVRLLTTGRFTANMHPHLLKTGEVTGLQWDEANPLLTFIQQIIETFRKPAWDTRNIFYSYIARYFTIKYGILDMMKHPPQDFAEVASTHFQLKINDILVQIGKWMEDLEYHNEGDLEEAYQSNPVIAELFKTNGVQQEFEELYGEIIEANEEDNSNKGSSSSDTVKEEQKYGSGDSAEW